MMNAMREDERFELTAQQRERLEALSPEERHAASDELHSTWYWSMHSADSVDDIVNTLLSYERNDAATGLLTSFALYAECLRAYARGDKKAVAEYAEAAKQYQHDGPIVIKRPKDN